MQTTLERLRGTLEQAIGPLGATWWRPLVVCGPQDYLLGLYLAVLATAVAQAPASAERTQLLRLLIGTLLAFVAALVVARGNGEPQGWRLHLSRLAPVAAVMVPYAQLRRIIPLANPALYDRDIYAFDLQVFGFEPAVALEELTTRPVVEWLSAWYMSYWVIGGVLVLSLLLGGGERSRASRLMLPLVLTLAIGHLLYLVVPGTGPWLALRHEFAGPLPGGPLYAAMVQVCAAGAQLDIFPSLHTGHMVLFSLFFFAEARESRLHAALRWPLAFAAVNVVAATMLLRWHYAADVVAGAIFAAVCFEAGRRLQAWWEQRRQEAGLAPAFW